MPRPLLSVIVPVYNGASHLKESLEALLSQTFADFELLIIDDGSKDASPEIVHSFKDSRIRYIRQENKGLCHTLNRGVQESIAPYIARNDQDDVSMPHRLERQMDIISRHPEAVAVYSHYSKFGLKRAWNNADKQTINNGSVKEVDPLQDGCLLGSSMLARTDALQSLMGFRQETYPCDDFDLELRLSQIGKLLLAQENLVAYRFHSGANTYRLFSVMQDKSRWVRDCHYRRQSGMQELKFEEYLKSRPLSRWARLQEQRVDLASLHLRVAGLHFLNGHDTLASLHTGLSFLFDPNNLWHRLRTLKRRRP